MFSDSEFELNREQPGGVLSIWSHSSRSYFGGLDGVLPQNGTVGRTMFGGDYERGPLTVGLSVGRIDGLGGASAWQMTPSMTGFYPRLGDQLNDRVSDWGVTRYGTGALSLTPHAAAALEVGAVEARPAGCCGPR